MSLLLKKLNLLFSDLSISLLLIIGISIIIVSFGLSLTLIPTKTLSMIVSSIGSILGTFVITLSLTKRDKVVVEEKRETIKKEFELEEKLKQIKSVEFDNENLRAEIEELKFKKLNVSSVERILELGVAKAKMRSYDYQLTTLKKEKATIGRDEELSYLGVFKYQYTAKLGIDLLKVKLKDIGDNTIEVSGIKAETLGFTDSNVTPILCEIRSNKTGSNLLGDECSILMKHDKLSYHKDSQRSRLDSFINNGADLSNFNQYVSKYTKDFLTLLLSPVGKHINFVDTPSNDGENINDYFIEHNRRIEKEILSLNEKQKKNLLAHQKYESS